MRRCRRPAHGLTRRLSLRPHRRDRIERRAWQPQACLPTRGPAPPHHLGVEPCGLDRARSTRTLTADTEIVLIPADGPVGRHLEVTVKGAPYDLGGPSDPIRRAE